MGSAGFSNYRVHLMQLCDQCVTKPFPKQIFITSSLVQNVSHLFIHFVHIPNLEKLSPVR